MLAELLPYPTEPVDEALGEGSGYPGDGRPARAAVESESLTLTGDGEGLIVDGTVDGAIDGAGAGWSIGVGSFSGVVGLRGFREPGMTTDADVATDGARTGEGVRDLGLAGGSAGAGTGEGSGTGSGAGAGAGAGISAGGTIAGGATTIEIGG